MRYHTLLLTGCAFALSALPSAGIAQTGAPQAAEAADTAEIGDIVVTGSNTWFMIETRSR